MKRSRSTVDTRREKIIRRLEEDGVVRVEELSVELGTSSLTVRRDLEFLAGEGRLERFYGGAALIKSAAGENIFSSGLTLHKQAIAVKAAAMVEDGDTIFVNTSSTALMILPHIAARQVTVITNNARAINSRHREDMMLVLTGGELRLPKEAMVGEFAVNSLKRVTASKCFLGCNGISVKGGVTTAVLQEAAVNELMLTRVTGPRIILADRTKVGRTLSFIYGSTDMVSCLVTDTEASDEELAQLREHMQVIQVTPAARTPLRGRENG